MASDNFTNQLPRVATAEECKLRWGGGRPGDRFRCYLCGHKFAVGDVWRWVFDNDDASQGGMGNFVTCAACDGHDVRERWWRHCAFAKRALWWFRKRELGD